MVAGRGDNSIDWLAFIGTVLDGDGFPLSFDGRVVSLDVEADCSVFLEIVFGDAAAFVALDAFAGRGFLPDDCLASLAEFVLFPNVTPVFSVPPPPPDSTTTFVCSDAHTSPVPFCVLGRSSISETVSPSITTSGVGEAAVG